jgi:hypothetical protein
VGSAIQPKGLPVFAGSLFFFAGNCGMKNFTAFHRV